MYCSLIVLVLFYCSKYTAVISLDQRQHYKDDFNAEYDEYRILHARVESVTRRFTKLDAQCRRLAPGTKEYQVGEQDFFSFYTGNIHRTVYICVYFSIPSSKCFSCLS